MKNIILLLVSLFIVSCLIAGCDSPVATEHPVKTEAPEQCIKNITITFKDHTQITHIYTTLEYNPLLDNNGYAFVIMNDKKYIATYQTDNIESLFCY